MRFVKIPNFELMKKGTTMNGLTLNEDIIEESVIHNVFDNAPIIYNEHQTLQFHLHQFYANYLVS